MSTENSTGNRIEVIYTEMPSFSTRRHSGYTAHLPNVDHLTPVGSINSGGEVYADDSVIDEVNLIRNLGLRAHSLIYHATSSVALPAIARQEALLSSEQLLKIQEPILTGEITTEEGWLHHHTNGLSDVYASSSAISTHYAQLKGDHYPVLFGIDPKKLESHPSEEHGDGMRLGARVALKSVAAQIVPFEKVHEIKDWSSKNCPDDTITMSLDAAFLLTYGLGYRS